MQCQLVNASQRQSDKHAYAWLAALLTVDPVPARMPVVHAAPVRNTVSDGLKSAAQVVVVQLARSGSDEKHADHGCLAVRSHVEALAPQGQQDGAPLRFDAARSSCPVLAPVQLGHGANGQPQVN